MKCLTRQSFTSSDVMDHKKQIYLFYHSQQYDVNSILFNIFIVLVKNFIVWLCYLELALMIKKILGAV